MNPWPLVCLSVFMIASPAAAQGSASASFSVGADISTGCAIGGSSQTTGINFGTLAFGSYPAVASGTVNTSVAASGGGVMQLQCTPGVTPSVAVGAGLHANGSQRRLGLSGGNTKVVSYALYADAARTKPIPVSGAVASSTVSASGLLTMPVYAVATLPGGGLTPGVYTDQLSVTVTW